MISIKWHIFIVYHEKHKNTVAFAFSYGMLAQAGINATVLFWLATMQDTTICKKFLNALKTSVYLTTHEAKAQKKFIWRTSKRY